MAIWVLSQVVQNGYCNLTVMVSKLFGFFSAELGLFSTWMENPKITEQTRGGGEIPDVNHSRYFCSAAKKNYMVRSMKLPGVQSESKEAFLV